MDKEMKIKWDYFLFKPVYDKNKKDFDKVFLVAKNKISEFEKKNNLDIIVFFNHNQLELTLYSCSPDNDGTKAKCFEFLDSLNLYLKKEVEYPQIS